MGNDFELKILWMSWSCREQFVDCVFRGMEAAFTAITIVNLSYRQRHAEWMDQPELDECAHRNALVGIGRVNAMSRIGHVLWRVMDRIITQRRIKRVHVLDMACGGGDLAICLARLASRRNLDFFVDGFDISRTAVDHARAQAVAANVRNVHFFARDALHGSLGGKPQGRYDIVMCSLFLHHLEEGQVVDLLQTMVASARHAVIVDDLQRSRRGYALAWIGCRLLTRSPMVHVDGPLSVRGAFTVQEARSLAVRAGLQNAQITKHWPQRFLMTWQRASHGGNETNTCPD